MQCCAGAAEPPLLLGADECCDLATAVAAAAAVAVAAAAAAAAPFRAGPIAPPNIPLAGVLHFRALASLAIFTQM